jgi:hypothetical protein
MPASVRELIQEGLVTRLRSITAANGYDTDVISVFSDDVPMGLQLDEFQLPAIIVVGGDDKLQRSHQCVKGEWKMEIQLFHKLVPDSTMNRFVRDVAKAIFANSPTAQRNEAWRGPQPAGFHESVYEVWLDTIDSDLGMIEANRFYIVHFVIRYETRPHNL